MQIRAQSLAPLALNFNANVGMIHYYARRYEDAVTQLETTLEFRDAAKSRYVSTFDVATIHAALGQTEAALDSLEQAVEQRAQPINFLGVDPAFDVLRRDARFQRILGSLGAGGGSLR